MTQVAIDPTNNNIVYVGTDLAGIFKSVDGGKSFRFIDKGLVNLEVQKIVIDPKNTDILYLGTQGGLYKSIDGGENWVLKENGFIKSGAYLSHPIKAIAIDPKNSNILYAGYGVGPGNSEIYHPYGYELYSLGYIFKSTDAGGTWQVVNTGTQKIETPTFIMEIAVNPNNSNTLFCTTQKGLYKSTDGGVNWQKKNQGLPADDVRGIAINPNNPDTMYLSVMTPPGVAPWQGGIYKSTDQGENWVAKTNGLEKVFTKDSDNICLTSNYPNIIISPSNPNVLYTGDFVYGVGGIFKSADGGETWTHKINYNISLNFFGNVAVFDLAVSKTNPDVVYFTTSMTVQKSENGGDTWVKAHQTEINSTTIRSHGIENTNLEDIAVNPTNPNIIYFLYADIWLFRSSDGGATFEEPVRTIPGYSGWLTSINDARLALDPQNPDTIFMSGYLEISSGYGIARFVKSADGGKSWSILGNETTGFPASGISSIAIDPTTAAGSRTIYITSNKNLGVFKSVDGGRNWAAINNGLGTDLTAGTIAISPTNSNILYLGTSNSFYKSVNAGATWTRSDTLNVLAEVKNIVINPQNPDIMYVSTWKTWDTSRNPQFKQGGIFKSTDGGLTWNNINPSAWSDYPISDQVLVNALAMDPTNPNILYMGNNDAPYYDDYSKCTIYRTKDAGSTWEIINNNLSNQDGLLSIAIAPSNPGIIYVGVGGSGGFKGTIADTTPPTYKAEDINQDGTVNTQDLQAAANQILGTQSWPRADVNQDGKFDVKDLQKIANVILGA